MAAEIEFCLLGPLMVRRGGVAVTVPRGKQRVILAMLLLNAGQIVRLDELAETLWVSGPPPSGLVAVQNYVMRLRNALGDAGRDRIITQPRGYLFRVQASELDLSRFEALLAAARTAARDCSWNQAATNARAALELWRGEPLADVDSEALAAREAPRLAELRLQTREIRIDADLHLGRHAEVITEVRQLAGTHPLRERLHAQLMLALYRDRRQGEALAAYQAARDILVAELGTEPGAELRTLHQQILTGDPVLAAPGSASPVTEGAGPAVPRELPARVRHFTGRAGELAALTRLLDQASAEAPGTVVISAIGGTAGVGKTALAVHWAHQVAGRFPDGQLYVNLRGYDPGQPMPAADALAGFLRALGVPGQEIPPEEAERATRYRSLLTGRRLLVILDNAGSAEQVRPLLPGCPACVVVVTSRDSLAGLVALDGAIRLDLDMLPDQDAFRLLRALVGERADVEPAATAALADQCCRLPLALRVAAELAVARPADSLADLADELADQQRRLDLLDAAGDPRAAVRAVFSWSYRHLEASIARTFRLLRLYPGPDYGPYAVAALTGTSLESARRLLGQLARAHLIQPTAQGRYGMHDLLHAYAGELTTAIDPQTERRTALTRLFDHYLHTTVIAMNTLRPAEGHRRPRIHQPDTPSPPVSNPTAARDWLDAERETLLAVAAHTAEHGWPGHTTGLSATLQQYLDDGGHNSEAITIHTHARLAAQQAGDTAAEALALNHLGLVDWRQGRLDRAASQFHHALALFRQAEDRSGQATVLGNLGLIDQQRGRYRDAIGYQQHALALYRETGHLPGEINTLSNLGVAEEYLGRYDQATHHLQQSLELARRAGVRNAESIALNNLGDIELRRENYQLAITHQLQALSVSRETSNRNSEAYALASLGLADLRLGHYQQATGTLQQALRIFGEIGDQPGTALTLNSLGEALSAAGQPGSARIWYTTALDLASQIGDRYEQARAHDGLSCGYHETGETALARRHRRQALDIYTSLGTPEAEQIRAQLTRLRVRSEAASGTAAIATATLNEPTGRFADAGDPRRPPPNRDGGQSTTQNDHPVAAHEVSGYPASTTATAAWSRAATTL